MNKVIRRTVTLLPPLVYVGLFVFLQVYAFSHSLRADVALAALMLLGPLFVGFTYARLRNRHHLFEDDPLKPYRGRITIGFMIGFVWFLAGSYLVKDPDGQLLIALAPLLVGFVSGVSYFSDKASRDRREEQKRQMAERYKG
jgi:uncharacterized membrane protein YfcA